MNQTIKLIFPWKKKLKKLKGSVPIFMNMPQKHNYDAQNIALTQDSQ